MGEIVHTALNLYVNGFYVTGVKDIAIAKEASVSSGNTSSNFALNQSKHLAVASKSENTNTKENSADSGDSVTISGDNYDEAQDVNRLNYSNLAVYRKLDSSLVNRIKLNGMHALVGVPNPISIVTAIESMHDDIRLQGRMTGDPASLITLLKNITKE